MPNQFCVKVGALHDVTLANNSIFIKTHLSSSMSANETPAHITLTLDARTKINVLDDTNLMTRFILEEQGDWFEDELPFIRRFLKPGMQAIDIGANYGCYALSIAEAVKNNDTPEKSGNVFAFEPCGDTFTMLQSSVNLNNFKHLHLIQSGLSNQSGQATLYRSHNSELNSLQPQTKNQVAQETITLTTLDDCLKHYQWKTLDFLKLDAEGEERNILIGGKQTFTDLSPLVMFELKHGKTINVDLINDFKTLDYQCFSLNKALDLLLPFNPNTLDGFQLNVFACKADMAEQLESKGLLSRHSINAPKKEFEARKNQSNQAIYQHIIEQLKPSLLSNWASSHDTKSKLSCLQNCQLSYLLLQQLSASEPNNIAFKCAYTRAALMLGKRVEAVAILRELLTLTDPSQNNNLVHIESRSAIISPIKDFDLHNESWQNDEPIDITWLRAAILQAYIELHVLSCYFSNSKIVPILKEANQIEYSSPAMQIREDMINELIKQHRAKQKNTN